MGKDGKTYDRNESAEKSYDKTECYIICLNPLHLSVSNKEWGHRNQGERGKG
jgi:hypothetical protein